jgi:hypothetical protein
MEGAVSDGVVELEKVSGPPPSSRCHTSMLGKTTLTEIQTIQLLEVFPSEEMMQWMEDTVGKLEGGRAA